jgi:glycosyl transferase family 25
MDLDPELFTAFNVYYDKILVLSVPSAVERRKVFTERFRGLNYQFYYGADKNNFSIDEVKDKKIYNEDLTRKHHRFGKEMKHGEIACSWSHRMMYEELLAGNGERLLIFEDDAVPDPAMLPLVPQIIDEIPGDCELLMWGWAKNGTRNFTSRIKQLVYHFQHLVGKLKWDHKMISNIYAKPFSRHIKHAGFHDYTYAYAISRSGARKLIDMQTPVQYIADNLLAHAATREIINAYIVSPPVFLHDNLVDGTHRDSYIR